MKKYLILFAAFLAIVVDFYAYSHHLIIAYGDAESHLNIAKRVIDGLTPGFAQLGGIWLPLPHLMLVPFVSSDFLWRTGLAGSIVSGICFIVSAYFIYKLAFLLTKNAKAGLIAALVFILNLNILYMQTTPLTELPLIMFLILSTYYFVLYLKENSFNSLILAALWGLAASLSRYDGWFLVAMEGFIVFAKNFTVKDFIKNNFEGQTVIYSTLAFAGIAGWLLWGWIILGDPFYFTNSQFSAKSQQQGFLQRGELPAYHNLLVSFHYYLVTTFDISGIIIFGVSVAALAVFLLDRKLKNRFYIVLLFMVPFIFYVVTLYLGQSIIFIPGVTPANFQWQLFNVRYGLMMIPAISVLVGYLFARVNKAGKVIIVFLIIANLGLFVSGYTKVLTLEDGTIGLSRSSHPDAELWLHAHYDNGLVILDDYARTISIIGSGVPMQNIVYVGTKPYWGDALKNPQNVVKWVVMQRNDAVWDALYANKNAQANLYKYFKKVYTSDNVLIFERDN